MVCVIALPSSASLWVSLWLDALADAALGVECPLFSIFPSSESIGGIISPAADLRTPVPGGKFDDSGQKNTFHPSACAIYAHYVSAPKVHCQPSPPGPSDLLCMSDLIHACKLKEHWSSPGFVDSYGLADSSVAFALLSNVIGD